MNVKMVPGDSMRDHLHKIRMITSQLAAIDEAVGKKELAHIVLNSLTPNFDNIIVLLSGKDKIIEFEYLKARLMQEEMRQKSTDAAKEGALMVKTTDQALLTREQGTSSNAGNRTNNAPWRGPTRIQRYEQRSNNVE